MSTAANPVTPGHPLVCAAGDIQPSIGADALRLPGPLGLTSWNSVAVPSTPGPTGTDVHSLLRNEWTRNALRTGESMLRNLASVMTARTRICRYRLNGEPFSDLRFEGLQLRAFSGLGEHVNRAESACIADQGPIPPGTYYVVDRESGGRLGAFRDWAGGRQDWFALYAEDGSVDDQLWCDEVSRGQFRLHPRGRRGISSGCIVIENPADFAQLSRLLRNGPAHVIPTTRFVAWAKLHVS